MEDMALQYALGTLPESEVAAFEEAMRREPAARELAYEFQRIGEAAARDGAAEAPFHSYSSIMARIDALEGAAAVPAPVAGRGRAGLLSFAAWSGWGLAACASVALGLALWGGSAEPGRPDIVLNDLANPRLVAVTPPSAKVGLETRMLELSGLAEAYWFAREGVPVDQQLDGLGSELAGEPLTGGFTIFDRSHQIGFIAVENLPLEQEGKSYHVWARTGSGSQAVRAGALPIGNESRGLFFFDLSSLPKASSLDQVSFFVTEESSSDPAKPGPMVVLSHF